MSLIDELGKATSERMNQSEVIHTQTQTSNAGMVKDVKVFTQLMNPCKCLSNVDIPLVTGFDSIKKFYGLFIEHRTRKCSLCMHGFCFALFPYMEGVYMLYLARKSCYAAATSPASALEATAVGAVDTAVTFTAFVDIAIFLTVTVPQ